MSDVTVDGFHHVTLPVENLQTSTEWYEMALGAKRESKLDHFDDSGLHIANILHVPGLATPLKLQLRHGNVSVVRGYDPVTFGAASIESLERWSAHFTACGVAHSPVTRARVGSTISFVDPDGTPLRLYATTHDAA
jgi:catechol 2,3-dioxygenase-like lactoylglutathione lyase family enzyme